jgi:hypothetical protein
MNSVVKSMFSALILGLFITLLVLANIYAWKHSTTVGIVVTVLTVAFILLTGVFGKFFKNKSIENELS